MHQLYIEGVSNRTIRCFCADSEVSLTLDHNNDTKDKQWKNSDTIKVKENKVTSSFPFWVLMAEILKMYEPAQKPLTSSFLYTLYTKVTTIHNYINQALRNW